MVSSDSRAASIAESSTAQIRRGTPLSHHRPHGPSFVHAVQTALDPRTSPGDLAQRPLLPLLRGLASTAIGITTEYQLVAGWPNDALRRLFASMVAGDSRRARTRSLAAGQSAPIGNGRRHDPEEHRFRIGTAGRRARCHRRPRPGRRRARRGNRRVGPSDVCHRHRRVHCRRLRQTSIQR